MSEDNFDEEFARAFAAIKELRSTVATLTEKIESLEKRELLRVRGNQWCRICHRYLPTETWNPPISEWEQKFHDANHATGTPGDRSKGLAAFGPTTNWDDIEKQVAHYKKPH